MKFKTLNTLLAPLLACSLTTGAIFATVSAAAAQDAAPIEAAPIDVAPIPVPGQPAVPQPQTDPASVLHGRKHHVNLDANGGFSGRLIALDSADGATNPAGGMNVKIIRKGVVIASTTSNEDGTFNVSGIGEGVVSVLGTGSNHFLLFSVELMHDENNALAAAIPVSLKANAADIGLHTAVVRSSDIQTVKQLIFGALPTGDYRFTSDLTESENQYPHGENETSTSLSHHAVQLQADGTLVGEVNVLDARSGRHREVNDLTLHFVKDGQHVGATAVQTDGRFQMAGLAPGRYSIATTGRDGILAMGIEIVGALANVQKEDEFKLTSIVQSLDLCVSPSQPGDFNAQNAEQLTGEDQPASDGEPVGVDMVFQDGGPAGGAPGGTGGGGSGGGGSGGGGGGGLGALLGAAAAGAIGYAVGNDRSASPKR